MYGGRWNPVGIEAVYTANSPSLAALEILANNSELAKEYRLTEVSIPEDLDIEVLDFAAQDLPYRETQRLGKVFFSENRASVLSVPSAVMPDCPTERNYVLNPKHPEFKRIKFFPSSPFRFDPRLK